MDLHDNQNVVIESLLHRLIREKEGHQHYIGRRALSRQPALSLSVHCNLEKYFKEYSLKDYMCNCAEDVETFLS